MATIATCWGQQSEVEFFAASSCLSGFQFSSVEPFTGYAACLFGFGIEAVMGIDRLMKPFAKVCPQRLRPRTANASYLRTRKIPVVEGEKSQLVAMSAAGSPRTGLLTLHRTSTGNVNPLVKNGLTDWTAYRSM